MRELAEREHWTIVEELIEPGESATTAARPVLQGMLKRIATGSLQCNVVLTHKLNRFARNLDDFVPIRAELRRYGVRLQYVVERVDDSPQGLFMENVMASMAQFESMNLSEETKKGMRERVLQGGWPHRPPRGYVTVPGRPHSSIAIHPRLGPLMKAAFELYATGTYSIDALARRLAAGGLTTTAGQRISKANLRRLLENPFYAGQLHWQGLRCQGAHPALVSPEVFKKVQAVLRDRRRDCRRPRQTPGLPLRGLAICSSCRGNMSGEWHKRWAYYRCSRQSYRRELCAGRLCSAVRAHADLKRVCLQVQVPAAVARAIRRAAARLLAERGKEARRVDVEANEAALLSTEHGITAAFVAGDLSPDAYATKTADNRQRREDLESIRSRRSADPSATMARVDRTLAMATTLWDLYQQLNDRRQLELLRQVFSTIVLCKDGISGYVLRPPFSAIKMASEADTVAAALLDSEAAA